MEGRLSLVAGGQVPVTICHQEKERITRFAVFRWRHLGLPCSTPGCSFSVPRSFLMVLALYVARADNPKSTLCVVVQVRLHGSLHELSPSVLAAQVSPWLKKSRMVCTKPCIPAIGGGARDFKPRSSTAGAEPLGLPRYALGRAGFPVSRCGFTYCVEGSPLPSTRCLMAPCPVTRLSHVRETARPGDGRVCRPIRVACALLCGVPHVFIALSCSSWRQGWPHLFLPVYRALADCGLAGLPEQSSGPSPLVHVPDEGPAGRASNIGGRLLEIR